MAIAEFFPELRRVVDTPLEPAPELNPEGVRDRFRDAVERLVLQVDHPTLIVLEDLHWAQAASIDVLQGIAASISGTPVILVGTVREGELADGIARTLRDNPTIESMRLHRLDRTAVGELSRSMLGAAAKPGVVEFLERETEGNPFFLVEVARELADAVGRLDRIGDAPLPERVFPHGIRRVVDRHLARVSSEDLARLVFAAAVGRTIDEDVVRAGFGDGGDGSLQAWLRRCTEAAILEPTAERYRFAHDKFREALLRDLDDAGRRRIHRRVARAIESTVDDPDSRAEALALHWRRGGNPQRELRFASIAARRALGSGAYSEAVSLLERVLELIELLPHRRNAAKEDQARRATWERQLGRAYLGLGQPEAALAHLQQSLRTLGHPAPRHPGLAAIAAAREVARQVNHRLRSPATVDGDERERLLEVVRAYEALMETYHHSGEPLPLLHAALSTLNHAERVGACPELAMAYASMTATVGLIPWRAMAEAYSERAQQVLASAGDDLARLWVLQLCGYYRLGNGEWSVAHERFRALIDLAEKLRFHRYWETGMSGANWIRAYRGRPVDDWDAIRRSAQRRGDPQMELGAIFNMVELALRTDELEWADRLLTRGESLFEASPGDNFEACLVGLRALERMRSGHPQDAARSACRVLDILGGEPPVAAYVLSAHTAATETLLEALEQLPPFSRRRSSRAGRRVAKALRGLAGYTRVFPPGRPALLRFRGTFHALLGEMGRAESLWERAELECTALDAQLELTELAWVRGRLTPGDAGCAWLERARERFARSAATGRAARAESLLSERAI